METNPTQKNKWFRTKTIFPDLEAKQFKKFYWKIPNMVYAIKERLKLDKDCMILVTGATGSGKSHLTGQFCLNYFIDEINFIKNTKKINEEQTILFPDDIEIEREKMFNPKKHFIISSEEFAYKMISEEGSVLWGDEFRSASNNRNWANPINKSILDRKNTNRKLNNIYFLCMPLETEFDKKLMAHLHIWIWVKKRGIGEVYTISTGSKGGTNINIFDIIEREKKYKKENPTKKSVPPWIHPEFVGYIPFSKLSKGLEKLYKKLVKEKKAVGDLTDEEKAKFELYKDKTPEEIVKEKVSLFEDGKITIRDLWLLSSTEMGDELTEKEKLTYLNFQLQLLGYGTYSQLIKKWKNG